MIQEIQFPSEEIKSTTPLNILFPVLFVFGLPEDFFIKCPAKKCIAIAAFEIYQLTPIGQFYFWYFELGQDEFFYMVLP